MKKWNRILAAFGIGALALITNANSASAAQIIMSSTVAHSGFAGVAPAVTPLTGIDPYDFAGQGYQNLTSIDEITVTMSINDGHTGVGEFDFNNLTLGLDGIDTGLKLNGFISGNIVTLTLSSPNNAGALLAALQADGQLIGSIIDATPNDNFISLPGQLDTTLDITGTLRDGNGGGPNQVPLPAAVLIAPLGALIAGKFSKRFRK